MLALSRKLILLTFASAALVRCQSLPVETIPENADPSAQIDELTKARDAAVAANVNTLAPQNIEEVNAQIKEAQHERNSGADAKAILEHVALGKAHLKKANEVAEISKSTLPDVIEARRLAEEAKAPDLARAQWDDVERDFKSATAKIEGGDLGLAESTRNDMKARFAAVELTAIKQAALGNSVNTVEQAKREGAEQWAPRSLSQAQAQVKQAEAFIDANRHDKAGIEAQAKTAADASAQLLTVTRQAKVAQKTDAESIVLQQQDQAAKLAAEKAAADKAAAAASAAISGTQATAAQLQTENTKLAAQQAYNQKFSAAQTKFSSNEAEVLRQGDNLLIRLKGLDFASGKAAIPPKNFELLGKVIAVAKDFGTSKVAVEGHTDAVGGKKNQKLSEDRAAAVLEYLAANGIDRSALTSTGFGDSRPIASNKTAAGRAQNRRVDVIITPSSDLTAH